MDPERQAAMRTVHPGRLQEPLTVENTTALNIMVSHAGCATVGHCMTATCCKPQRLSPVSRLVVMDMMR